MTKTACQKQVAVLQSSVWNLHILENICCWLTTSEGSFADISGAFLSQEVVDAPSSAPDTQDSVQFAAKDLAAGFKRLEQVDQQATASIHNTKTDAEHPAERQGPSQVYSAMKPASPQQLPSKATTSPQACPTRALSALSSEKSLAEQAAEEQVPTDIPSTELGTLGQEQAAPAELQQEGREAGAAATGSR